MISSQCVASFRGGLVAEVTVVALSVRKNAPRPGTLFLFLATSMALATDYGRHHHAAYAVAGAMVGVGAYFPSMAIQRWVIEPTDKPFVG